MAEAQAVTVVDRAVHPSGIVPTLQNVVATVNLGTRLDLKEIALHARNAEYNPKVRDILCMRALASSRQILRSLCLPLSALLQSS